VRITSDPAVMGRYANGPALKLGAWLLFALISAANVALLVSLLR
jgi:manganese transport protein